MIGGQGITGRLVGPEQIEGLVEQDRFVVGVTGVQFPLELNNGPCPVLCCCHGQDIIGPPEADIWAVGHTAVSIFVTIDRGVVLGIERHEDHVGTGVLAGGRVGRVNT